MKTWNTIIGAAAMAVITLNLSASEALLSPRAKANLDRPVASAADSRNLATENRGFMGSPRALGNVGQVQSAAADGVNLAAVGRNIVASPRGAQTFPQTATVAGCDMACCAKK